MEPPHKSWEERMNQPEATYGIDFARLPDITPADAQQILDHCVTHAGDYRDPENPHAIACAALLEVMDKETPRLAGVLEVLQEHAARPEGSSLGPEDRAVMAGVQNRMALYWESDHEAVSLTLALYDALAEILPGAAITKDAAQGRDL